MKLLKYQCECCGGTIDMKTLRCEFCGMTYKIENEQIFRIERYTAPIDTLKSRQLIPNGLFKDIGAEEASEIAIRELSRSLAKIIAPYMKIETRPCYEQNSHEITATVKIVKPTKE